MRKYIDILCLLLLGAFSFAGTVMFAGIFFVAPASTLISGLITLSLCWKLLNSLHHER